METIIGEKGLSKSWQEKFPKTMKCKQCGGIARVVFVAYENPQEDNDPSEFVCNLHENKGKGGYWFHDCVAVAVYLCKDCFEVNAIVNQA